MKKYKNYYGKFNSICLIKLIQYNGKGTSLSIWISPNKFEHLRDLLRKNIRASENRPPSVDVSCETFLHHSLCVLFLLFLET